MNNGYQPGNQGNNTRPQGNFFAAAYTSAAPAVNPYQQQGGFPQQPQQGTRPMQPYTQPMPAYPQQQPMAGTMAQQPVPQRPQMPQQTTAYPQMQMTGTAYPQQMTGYPRQMQQMPPMQQTAYPQPQPYQQTAYPPRQMTAAQQPLPQYPPRMPYPQMTGAAPQAMNTAYPQRFQQTAAPQQSGGNTQRYYFTTSAPGNGTMAGAAARMNTGIQPPVQATGAIPPVENPKFNLKSFWQMCLRRRDRLYPLLAALIGAAWFLVALTIFVVSLITREGQLAVNLFGLKLTAPMVITFNSVYLALQAAATVFATLHMRRWNRKWLLAAVGSFAVAAVVGIPGLYLIGSLPSLVLCLLTYAMTETEEEEDEQP